MKREALLSGSIQASGSVLAFLGAALVGKARGLELLGEIGFLLAVIALAATVVSLGIAEQVQFLLANNPAEHAPPSNSAPPPLSINLKKQVVISAAAVALALTLHVLGGEVGAGGAALLCALAIPVGLCAVLSEIAARVDFQRGRFGRGQLINSAPGLLFWVGCVVCVLLDWPIHPIAIGALSWGSGAVVSIRMLRRGEVQFDLRTQAAPGASIQSEAFASRILVAAGAAAPYAFLSFIGAPAIAGVLSLASRLFGPIGIVFSSVTLAFQRKVFVRSNSAHGTTTTTCRIQLLGCIVMSLLLWAIAWASQGAGLIMTGAEDLASWRLVVLLLLLHRGLSLGFQFSSQTLLPFYPAKQVFLWGVATFAAYVPVLAASYLGWRISWSAPSIFFVGAPLIMQPLVGTLVIWFFSRQK